ncbi:hypothetical protein ACFY3O_03840 [Streptomyces sp. NPDC001046]|uniref:hypothetical protein n=1 Tax=unclassified Streptomyces TaxID=2593676 RepID=UPI0035DB1BAA
MTDHRLDAPGENGEPIPRDMPDQQADAGEDPWEVAPRFSADAKGDADDESANDEGPADDAREPAGDLPDTDEAGTGRQGAPSSGTEQTEHPVPDEPSG